MIWFPIVELVGIVRTCEALKRMSKYESTGMWLVSCTVSVSSIWDDFGNGFAEEEK